MQHLFNNFMTDFCLLHVGSSSKGSETEDLGRIRAIRMLQAYTFWPGQKVEVITSVGSSVS